MTEDEFKAMLARAKDADQTTAKCVVLNCSVKNKDNRIKTAFKRRLFSFIIKIAFQFVSFEKTNTKACREQTKGFIPGIIEKDEKGNYFCGPYLLDYKYTEAKFKLGDEVTIKSVIENPSDISYGAYPKKSRDFFLANDKPEHK